MASDEPGFLEELKRRHVVRVAIAYAVAGWLLVQVATQVFPFFNVPNWAVRLVVILLAIGFPVALAFAWIYELTPEGIRRTEAAGSPGARSEHANRQIGRKLNTLIIAVLLLAVALLGWRLYAVRHQKATAPIAAAAASSPDEVKRNPGMASAIAPDSAAGAAASRLPGASGASAASMLEKSVAVLPFANEGEKSEQFFSDGLSEDLITALSQFAGLKVISRNSAFQFRDSKDTSAEIGKLLGVAHLLEGSVQRAGDEVRITATLVSAADGSVVWSQRYDKPYKDLFALQDAITRSVAEALNAKLLTTAGAVVQSDRPPSGNLAAYAAYQHGIAYNALTTEAGVRQAIAAYQQAIAIDPGYAAAYAQLSSQFANLVIQYGVADAPAIIAKSRAAAAKALALDPDLALAHLVHAQLLLNMDMDRAAAEAEARRALQLAPNDAEAQSVLAGVLATLGQNARAVALIQQTIASDPRSAGRWTNLSLFLTALGRLPEARQAIDKAIALQPGATTRYEELAVVAILRGEPEAAVDAARKEPPGPWHDIAMALALQIGPDRAAADAALKALTAKYADTGPYQIAETYALRHDPDAVFQWLDHAWTVRDPGIGSLLSDPVILRYRDDPRFAAFCHKVGLPTATDAVAMKQG